MGFCICSSKDCIGCKEKDTCKKRKSTKWDLKWNFNAFSMLGISLKIEVIFATQEKNRESYGVLKKHFYGLLKPTILINPQLFKPEVIAYLHMKE